MNTTSRLRSTGKGNNRSKGKQRITSQSLQKQSDDSRISSGAETDVNFGVGMQAVNCHVVTPSRPQ